MKKYRINHIVVILVVVSIIIGIVLTHEYRSGIMASSSNNVELSDDDLLIDISRDDLNIKISDNENFFVYIGRPTCPDCKEFKLYKIVLGTGMPGLAGAFSWLRLQYKRMLGRG